MATFPHYAQVLVEGYGEEADHGVLRTEMDGGLAKQRPRYNTPIVTRDATILVLSDEDKESFDAWIDDELKGGAGWFDWKVPRTDRIVKARIVGGKYKWAEPMGTAWKATCQIETLGR